MGEDHRRRVVQQYLSQHLARMHAGAVDRAAEQLLEGNEPMAVIEVQAAYLNPGDRQRQPRTGKPTNTAEIAYLEGDNSVMKRQTTTGEDATL
jgi:hypothetical protein